MLFYYAHGSRTDMLLCCESVLDWSGMRSSHDFVTHFALDYSSSESDSVKPKCFQTTAIVLRFFLTLSAFLYKLYNRSLKATRGEEMQCDLVLYSCWNFCLGSAGMGGAHLLGRECAGAWLRGGQPEISPAHPEKWWCAHLMETGGKKSCILLCWRI